MTETILAVDVGLTNCKTVVFSPDGHVLARASLGYATLSPEPGWSEQDPDEWWAALLGGMGQIRGRAPESLQNVVAISVTGHMHALVPTARDGLALGPAMVLGDQRSLAEAEAITRELGLERIYTTTGARMDASMPVAKLRWLHRYAPGVHSRARSFLACKDWIRHRLTGDWLTDPIDACGTSLYDIQQGAWAPDLVALARVQPSQLPDVRDPCEVAGRLRARPAEEMGLQAGIPVVVGAGDDVEVIGNGLMGPGRSLEHLGTTGSILTSADGPVYDPLMAVELYPHVVPDLWVLGGSVTAAGSALGWARRVLRTEEDAAPWSLRKPDLDHPLVFVPHLLGERCPAWDPHARGAWIGLSAAHTSRDLRQSVVEGITFSLKSVLQRIEALVGPQERITVARSRAGEEGFLVHRASIYGRTLALLGTAEPTALGAMIVAAVGVGLYGSVADAVHYVTGAEQIVEPREDLARDYERLFELYQAASALTPQVTGQWDASAVN